MNVRRTRKTRRVAATLTIATGLALAASGCGGGDDDKPESESSSSKGSDQNSDNKGETEESDGDQKLAQVTGGDNIILTFTSAKRDEGGFVTVTGQVKNGSGNIWNAPKWQGDESELALKNGASMAGARLVDKSGKKRYYILRDTDGRCLCTTFNGFKPGESKTWYAQFPAPPEGNNKVDFQIADMPPASITISEG